MTLFALSPDASDFLTVWGFVAGVIGCLIGLLGFGYTIYQVRKVKAAAEAAEDAAKKTLAESKDAYERFVGAYASRLLSELQTAINVKDWKLGHVRCNDLAELLASLPSSGMDTMDSAATESVKSLRALGQSLAEMLAKGTTKLPPKILKDRWQPLLQLLHAQLDRLRAPFRENADGEDRAFDPT